MTTTEVATDLVLTERHDGVLTITINRPAQKNAVNREVAVQTGSRPGCARLRPDVVGGRADRRWRNVQRGHGPEGIREWRDPNPSRSWIRRLTQAVVRKPLIAAVEGWALGGGFEMALACDLIVAANTAKFGLTEVKRGLIAGEGGVIRLPQRIPYHVALEVLLTGEPISAIDANQYGLISELTASGAALAGAHELAHRIAGNAPLALAKVKQVLRETQGLNDADAFARQSKDAHSLLDTEDAHEGALAFAEKRAPVWRGR